MTDTWKLTSDETSGRTWWTLYRWSEASEEYQLKICGDDLAWILRYLAGGEGLTIVDERPGDSPKHRHTTSLSNKECPNCNPV